MLVSELQKERMQVEQTGFGSSVRLVNANANTVLRSCGLHEAVRDTVLADTSPAARWNLVPHDGSAWFSLHPASDESEVMLLVLTKSLAEFTTSCLQQEVPFVVLTSCMQ